MTAFRYVVIVLCIFVLCPATSIAGPKPVGDYLLSTFDDEIETSNADQPGAGFIRIALDGNGGGTYQDLSISDGGPLESGSFNYALNPIGEVKLFPGEGFIPGIVSSDAQFVSFAEIGENAPGIIFGVRKPTVALSMTPKTYIAAQISDDVDSPGPGQTADEPSVKLMNITLGAGGNGSYQDLYSSDGEIESGPFTYAIDSTPADGNLTVTITLPAPEPNLVFTGIISQDGSVFTFPFTIPYEPGIVVGIEKSNGDMDASKAKGKYIMCQFVDEIENLGLVQSADTSAAGIIEVTLDGQGNGTFREIYSSNPSGQTGSGTLTYTLTSNGELTVNAPGGGPINGVMSKNGNLFILAETAADYPAINIGIKKSPSANAVSSLLLLGN